MKKKKCVRHHILNRCQGGKSTPENLLYIEEEKEKMIHKIFFNKDFYDIVLLLLRLSKMKHYENVNPKIKRFYKFLN